MTARRDGAEMVHGADEAIPCATLDQLSGATNHMRDQWGDYGYRLGYAGSDRFVGRHSDGSVFTFHIDRYGNHYGADRT